MALATVFAAVISAAVAAGVAWITTRASFRSMLGQLKLDVQKELLEQIVEKRSAIYPKLYSLLSDLPKAAQGDSTEYSNPRDLFARVNEWDSEYSIFLGPDAANICWQFRQILRDFAHDFPELGAGATFTPEVRERGRKLLNQAKLLELALRSDLGIYGVDVDSETLSFHLPRIEDYERYRKPVGTSDIDA